LPGIRAADDQAHGIGKRGAPGGAGKKTTQIVFEQEREVTRILEKIKGAREADLEAWEAALRAAVLSRGAQLLEGLLKGIGCGRRPERVVCACGTLMESQGLKTKELLTILGPVSYARST
jgi:hypothetical protein